MNWNDQRLYIHPNISVRTLNRHPNKYFFCFLSGLGTRKKQSNCLNNCHLRLKKNIVSIPFTYKSYFLRFLDICLCIHYTPKLKICSELIMLENNSTNRYAYRHNIISSAQIYWFFNSISKQFSVNTTKEKAICLCSYVNDFAAWQNLYVHWTYKYNFVESYYFDIIAFTVLYLYCTL